MSALRISVPGSHPVLIPLGHDMAISHSAAMIALMRVPLEDRLARERPRRPWEQMAPMMAPTRLLGR